MTPIPISRSDHRMIQNTRAAGAGNGNGDGAMTGGTDDGDRRVVDDHGNRSHSHNNSHDSYPSTISQRNPEEYSEGEEEEARSINSKSSKRSAYSNKIYEASRRGERRAKAKKLREKRDNNNRSHSQTSRGRRRRRDREIQHGAQDVDRSHNSHEHNPNNLDVNDETNETSSLHSKRSIYSEKIINASQSGVERAAELYRSLDTGFARGMREGADAAEGADGVDDGEGMHHDNVEGRHDGSTVEGESRAKSGRRPNHGDNKRHRRKKKSSQSHRSDPHRSSSRQYGRRGSTLSSSASHHEGTSKSLAESHHTSSIRSNKKQQATFNLDESVRKELKSDNDPFSLPTTSDLLSVRDFDRSGVARARRQTNSKNNHSSNSKYGSVSSSQYSHSIRSGTILSNVSSITDNTGLSTLNTNIPYEKYNNKSFLASAAQLKFQKGLKCTRKRRYTLARSKFRAALKARILLYEDICHLSIAPVHEMIGHVERKLGCFEKSRLHLLAALEICERALTKIELEESEEMEMEEHGKNEGITKNSSSSHNSLEDNDNDNFLPKDETNNSLSQDAIISKLKEDMHKKSRNEEKGILRTNILRIQKTIEVVKRDERKQRTNVDFGNAVVRQQLGQEQRLQHKFDAVGVVESSTTGGGTSETGTLFESRSESKGHNVVLNQQSKQEEEHNSHATTDGSSNALGTVGSSKSGKSKGSHSTMKQQEPSSVGDEQSTTSASIAAAATPQFIDNKNDSLKQPQQVVKEEAQNRSASTATNTTAAATGSREKRFAAAYKEALERNEMNKNKSRENERPSAASDAAVERPSAASDAAVAPDAIDGDRRNEKREKADASNSPDVAATAVDADRKNTARAEAEKPRESEKSRIKDRPSAASDAAVAPDAVDSDRRKEQKEKDADTGTQTADSDQQKKEKSFAMASSSAVATTTANDAHNKTLEGKPKQDNAITSAGKNENPGRKEKDEKEAKENRKAPAAVTAATATVAVTAAVAASDEEESDYDAAETELSTKGQDDNNNSNAARRCSAVTTASAATAKIDNKNKPQDGTKEEVDNKEKETSREKKKAAAAAAVAAATAAMAAAAASTATDSDGEEPEHENEEVRSKNKAEKAAAVAAATAALAAATAAVAAAEAEEQQSNDVGVSASNSSTLNDEEDVIQDKEQQHTNNRTGAAKTLTQSLRRQQQEQLLEQFDIVMDIDDVEDNQPAFEASATLLDASDQHKPTRSEEAKLELENSDKARVTPRWERKSSNGDGDMRPSWGLMSINEEQEMSWRNDLQEVRNSANTNWDEDGDDPLPTTSENRNSSKEGSVTWQPKPKYAKPIATAEEKESNHIHSEDRLRNTYEVQSEKGEEYYNLEQYAMAIASFNDARFALLIIAGKEEKRQSVGEGNGYRSSLCAMVCARLRDRIDIALLLERITDCHVQKFFHGSYQSDATDDYSHVNYSQAVASLSETKDLLLEQIENQRMGPLKRSGNQRMGLSRRRLDESANSPSEEENNLDITDLRDLSNEVTLSLARIYSKQGYMYAKLDSHRRALDLFDDSITAWEKAGNIDTLPPQDHKENDLDLYMKEDPLIIKTDDLLSSYYLSTSGSEFSPTFHLRLKNMDHPEALATAVQMACSHHALGLELTTAEEDGHYQLEAAIEHHLHALKLVREASRMRQAMCVSPRKSSSRRSNRRTRLSRIRLSRDLSALMAPHEPKSLVDNVGKFMKTCILLQAQQQICISHACLSLGNKVLSRKWFMKAVQSINNLGLSDGKNQDEMAKYLLLLMVGEHAGLEGNSSSALGKIPRSVDTFSLYKGGLSLFSEGYEAIPRLLVHFGLAALNNGLHADTMDVFKSATDKICSSPKIPGYYEEVLHAIDARIIINVKDNDLDEALLEMNRRIDVVSRWLGNHSVALAKELHRLACLHSVLGNHKECVQHLKESVQLIGDANADRDTLDSMKLLATSHEILKDKEKAISEYKLALTMERDENFTEKAKLMNAIANLYMQVDGQCHQALEYLDQSLELQQDFAFSEHEDEDDVYLRINTMILYGNVMASKQSFTEAIQWYDKALNSNPDSNPIHPSNLRALYNMGITLFRSGDIKGADDVFTIVFDEVDKVSTLAQGITFVLNAIGIIYFAKNDYAGATKRFKKTLSLENDELSPRQRAGALCNTATAYYKTGNYEDAEDSFNRALKASKSSGEKSCEVEANITCKLAFILYKRKQYLRAYTTYTEAALLGTDGDHGNKIRTQCEGYAEACRLKVSNQNNLDDVPVPKRGVKPLDPQFEASLIPITDEQNATRCSDAVCSYNQKMLSVLGFAISDLDIDTSDLPAIETQILCDRALECLLERTQKCRDEYASEFEGLLAEKLLQNVPISPEFCRISATVTKEWL